MPQTNSHSLELLCIDTRMQRWESKFAMTIHTISNISGGRKIISHTEAFYGHCMFLQTITHSWGKPGLCAELSDCWLAIHADTQKTANQILVQSVAFAESTHAFLAFSCTWHHHVGSHMLGIKHTQTWIGFTNVNSRKSSSDLLIMITRSHF